MKLGVNVDHVATLRQARGGKAPDPVLAALVCQRAGADSIVMHLREDRRHIHDSDLFRARKAVRMKLNMEMSVAQEIVRVAFRVYPDQVTLVPEKRLEKTTEGGLDLARKTPVLRRVIDRFKKRKILVSLFIDPDLAQIELARKIGADAIELHTGDYANQTSPAAIEREFCRLKAGVFYGCSLGLTVHAGHGLDYQNVRRIVRLTGIEELNIGYSIITHSLWVGLDKAVRQMIRLIR